MDEAYTGSVGDGGADSESEDSNTMASGDPLFIEILKDENDGLAVSAFLLPGDSILLFQDKILELFSTHADMPDIFYTVIIDPLWPIS